MNLKLASWPKHPLFWILISALVLRVVAALVLGNTVSGLSGAHDEISYNMLGQRFAAGHGMTFPENWYPWIKANAPQSYFSYTFSLFLAGIYAVFGYFPIVARLIMALMSTGVIYMIFIIGRRLFDHQIALIASAIAAVYAYLIFYGVTLVTETPFILALLVAIYVALVIREGPSLRLWILLGISLAITVLLRMAVIFFVPVLLGWILWSLHERRHIKYGVIPIVILFMALLPFTMRNYNLWGHVMLLEAQFGHVFWNGNHPGHEGDFHPYKVFEIPEEVLESNNDAEITNELLRRGIRNVIEAPDHFLLLTLTRLREYFTFWPTQDSTLPANVLRVISFGLIVPFTIIGLVAGLRRWQMLLPVYLFMLIHTGVYAVSWTMIRYRIPVDVFFIIFTAYAIVLISEHIRLPMFRRLQNA